MVWAAESAKQENSMAFESYREFLNRLESAGELVRVSAPVATELEITAAADLEMKKPVEEYKEEKK